MGASTIVVAREDLSIPGAGDAGDGATGSTAEIEARFFNVLRQHDPDVVVLDLSSGSGNGTPAILKIRRRSGVPVLVVCAPGDPRIREYRLAGAASCMQTPVGIMELNQAVQRIIQLSQPARNLRATEANQNQPISFAGLTHYSHRNLLIGADGASIKLTTSENRALAHFVSNPLTLCTRDALAQALYGPYRPNSDRAVDVIVTRLRKKIGSLGGPLAQGLIKTEFRRGYIFVAEVSVGAPLAAQRAEAPRQVRTA